MIQAATTRSVYVTLSVRRYDLFKVNCTEEGGLKSVSPRRGLTIWGMTKAGRDRLESTISPIDNPAIWRTAGTGRVPGLRAWLAPGAVVSDG